jgi:hypothetical protein
MKRMFLTVGIIFIVMIIGLFVFACESPAGNTPEELSGTGVLQSVKNSDIKSLYTSNLPLAGSESRAVISESDIKTLSYIDNDGENSPVIFITSNGKEVILEIGDVIPVDNKRIIATYSAIIEVEETTEEGLTYIQRNYSSGKTLIDMSSGKLYDFSAYIHLSYPYARDRAFYSQGNTLFAIKDNGTLYKINLENIGAAIPLNNPQYAKVDSIKFILGNKIICIVDEECYSIDINAAYTPKPVLPFTIENCILEGYYGEPFEINSQKLKVFYPSNQFIDSNNDFWFYSFGYTYREESDGNYAHIKCKLTIDDEGQLGISDYSESTLPVYINHVDQLFGASRDGNIIYYSSVAITNGPDGLVIIKKDPSGTGIIIDSITRTMPSLIHGTYFIDNNYLYWQDGTSIKRMELTSNSAEQVIYSNGNLVTTRSPILSGNKIIFYQYFDATSVVTYSITIDNLFDLPTLISQSTVEIDNITELNF